MIGVSAIFMMGFAASLQAETNTVEERKGESVEYRILDPGAFQSFVKNWDNKEHPVLYAAIGSSNDWDAVFGPAPVMGRTRPFAPNGKLYEKELILIVSRVVKPPAAFKLEDISDSKGELVFRYAFKAGESNASFTIKQHMAVVVPKREYKTIAFIENGKRIGLLNIDKGQWSVPTMPDKPDAGDGK